MEWRKRNHRRRNYNVPGDAHALTFTCYRRFRFLTSERTCEWLAAAIDAARKAWRFDLWAFVFMPEHVHLVLQPREQTYDMAQIRHAIKEPVGRQAIDYLEANSPEWLARVTRRRGRKVERLFWQSGGGFDENIDDPVVLRKIIDYVHENPVRRGLVTRATGSGRVPVGSKANPPAT